MVHYDTQKDSNEHTSNSNMQVHTIFTSLQNFLHGHTVAVPFDADSVPEFTTFFCATCENALINVLYRMKSRYKYTRNRTEIRQTTISGLPNNSQAFRTVLEALAMPQGRKSATATDLQNYAPPVPDFAKKYS